MVFLYGPSGTGKTSLGGVLAERLNLPFIDLDQEIVREAGLSITEIFAQRGEAGFRQVEKAILSQVLKRQRQVVALGGGALLDPENRQCVEAKGKVVCLTASLDQLVQRLKVEPETRPLLAGEAPIRLKKLLTERGDHYASFPIQVDTGDQALGELARQVQVKLGEFHVTGMSDGYDVLVLPGGLDSLGDLLTERAQTGRVAVVSDANVCAIYGERVCQALGRFGFTPHLVEIPAGEQNKSLETVASVWERFIQYQLDRKSMVVALGGGVTGDLAGFSAATFLRGIPWVALPTSLLAMVDASLGGKTGFDLMQGKNLVGAFHSPRLVLADPLTLKTLPAAELCSGMAEVIKSGMIGDPALFELCSQGWDVIWGQMDEIISRSMAVKVDIIKADPYEKGPRAALNLGHTVGHALEQASDYRLLHGEAVAIGVLSEARLSEALGLARSGLAREIEAVLRGVDLPTRIPSGLEPASILEAMKVDKKNVAGELHFALPVEIGQVQVGVKVVGEDLTTLEKLLGSDL
jgi:shikimate kinase/3-dehydroquinate synthase